MPEQNLPPTGACLRCGSSLGSCQCFVPLCRDCKEPTEPFKPILFDIPMTDLEGLTDVRYCSACKVIYATARTTDIHSK